MAEEREWMGVHMALSVDVDRFSDKYIRNTWLDMFKRQFGVLTVGGIRECCAKARAKGLEVFPPCDHTDARGHCLGHKKDG